MKNYYKLIDNNNAIGVISSLDFQRFNTNKNFVVWCTDDDGEFVMYHDNLYRDNWLRPMKTDTISPKLVTIVSITEEEYDILYDIFKSGDSVTIPEEIPEDEPVPEQEPESPNVEMEMSRANKIIELNGLCNKAITGGFDIKLSDGETHHFSFNTND